MAESLQVVALISGGKDSFYSLLHCIQNGHRVVALGNLYPAPAPGSASAPRRPDASNHEAESEDEQDLNSFMYQTVGHTVIPLYEQALGIPLYRQQIVGGAVQTGTSYGYADGGSRAGDLESAMKDLEVKDEEEDETESLVPLLKKIMAEHPTANALSTGAILSTYQRTRVESVAIRLGLIPLSYLWQYPILPPGTQISLLEDMQAISLDARIVKVASGGLDESFLWQNVANQQVMGRIEKSMKRFGTDGDGAVLGEGGEFETLVVDGPDSLFKGRIEVEEKDRRVVGEGGGSAWLKILKARVVMKEPEAVVKTQCRTPDLLELRFSDIIASLKKDNKEKRASFAKSDSPSLSQSLQPLSRKSESNRILHWTVSANQSDTNQSISSQASKATEEIRQRLHEASLQPTDIISTVIILRSMQDFASINKVYGSLFTAPNPPSRVTISCGTLLPSSTSLTIHLSIQDNASSLTTRKALHVQSRSYWAPANIGPYSQAISITLPSPSSNLNTSSTPPNLVSIAGQIPLISHTMNLPPPLTNNTEPATSPLKQQEQEFILQATLSLQHLVRIVREMHISWLSSCVAYLPSSSSTPSPVSHTSSSASRTLSPASLTPQTKSKILSQAWSLLHRQPNEDIDSEDDEQSRDLWEEKHYAGMEIRGAAKDAREYPLWDSVDSTSLPGSGGGNGNVTPPFWIAEVEELPRGSAVEWAAGMGVVGGDVKLLAATSDAGWSIHQCLFDTRSFSIVMLQYSSDSSSVITNLQNALSSLGGERGMEKESVAAWVNVSIPGLWTQGNFGGGVPCRSIWDGEGRKLACVLLFENL